MNQDIKILNEKIEEYKKILKKLKENIKDLEEKSLLNEENFNNQIKEKDKYLKKKEEELITNEVYFNFFLLIKKN